MINITLGKKYIHLKRDETSVIQTVMASFIVDAQGNVSEVKIENPNDVHPKLAEEVIRVLSKSPKWIPAVLDGRNVNYRQKQNISFENSWK